MNSTEAGPTLAQLNERLLKELDQQKRIEKTRRGVAILFLVAVPFAIRAYGLPKGLLFLFVIAVFFVALDYWLSRSHRWRIRKLKSEIHSLEHE